MVKWPTPVFQGGSWLHVGTDQPFKAISIGGANQVWAIARDGAVFYRGSVSQQNPAGMKDQVFLVGFGEENLCVCVHEAVIYQTSAPCRRVLVPHPGPPSADAQAAVGGQDVCLRCG